MKLFYYLSRVKSIVLTIVIDLLSLFIKKDKKLHFYIPFQPSEEKFAGNIKALYEFSYNNKDYKSIIFAKTDILYKELKGKNYNVIKGNFKKLYYLVKANFIVIDGTTTRLISRNLNLIQLWHGIGFKNVGLENQNTSDKLSKILLKRHYNQYKLITSSSETDSLKHKNDFKVDSAIVTGLARNDVFFQEQYKIEDFKTKYNIKGYNKVILYAPTFRDNFTTDNFTTEFWEKLNQLMVDKNQLFIVKKHLWDSFFKVPSNYSNIKDYTKTVDDVQELLIVTDVLISDYSSIVTDFSITKRPIIYYLFDHQLYLEKCRSIFGDIEQILPGPFANKEDELYNLLSGEYEWQDEPNLKSKVNDFLNKYHYYHDGDSCKRIFEEIKRLENEK